MVPNRKDSLILFEGIRIDIYRILLEKSFFSYENLKSFLIFLEKA